MVKNNLKIVYSFLKEAEKGIPPVTQEQAMQVCEKLWASWAQATKTYKNWKTHKGYTAVIGELYRKYPKYAEVMKKIHLLAWTLHSLGFYEGVYIPTIEDLNDIKRGVKIIEKIITKNRK